MFRAEAGHLFEYCFLILSHEQFRFPFAAIAMALTGAVSTVLVSIPAVRGALLATAGFPGV